MVVNGVQRLRDLCDTSLVAASRLPVEMEYADVSRARNDATVIRRKDFQKDIVEAEPADESYGRKERRLEDLKQNVRRKVSERADAERQRLRHNKNNASTTRATLQWLQVGRHLQQYLSPHS